MKHSTFALLLIILSTSASPALRAQNVIDTPEGRAEVIGLRKWTAAMLADSLGLHAPGVSLFQTVECTKALTDRLHFSSVFIDKRVVAGSGNRAERVVIRIVEPQDSARNRWRAAPIRPEEDRAEWSELYGILRDSAGRFKEGRLVNPLGLYAMIRRGNDSVASDFAAKVGMDVTDTRRFWSALQRRTTARDLTLAIRALGTDGNVRNRMIAAAILANFPAADEAWRALVSALLDPYAGVHTAAMQSLSVLSKVAARPIDWAPSAPALRSLLDGTNLPAFMTVVDVLNRTRVSPRLASGLVGAGGELVVAHAVAEDRESREAAQLLLRNLSGRTTAPANWSAWIATLKK